MVGCTFHFLKHPHEQCMSIEHHHIVIVTRSQSTLIIAEHNNEKLNAATLNAVTAASQLGGEVKLLNELNMMHNHPSFNLSPTHPPFCSR